MVVKDDDGMIWFTTFTGWADCPLGHFAPRLMKTSFLSHDEVKNGQSMIHPALPQIAFGHFAPVLMLLDVAFGLDVRIIVHLTAMMRRGKISGQSFLTGFHTWSQRREDDHNKQCNICEKKVLIISGSAITLWILWIPQQTQRKSCKKPWQFEILWDVGESSRWSPIFYNVLIWARVQSCKKWFK